MNMKINADAAKVAVLEYEEQERAKTLAAAESKVSSIEKTILRESQIGHRFCTVCIESPLVCAGVRQILEDNGFVTTSENGKNVRIEW